MLREWEIILSFSCRQKDGGRGGGREKRGKEKGELSVDSGGDKHVFASAQHAL